MPRNFAKRWCYFVINWEIEKHYREEELKMSSATRVFLELLWFKMFDDPKVNKYPKAFPHSSFKDIIQLFLDHALVTKQMVVDLGFSKDCVNGLMRKLDCVQPSGCNGWTQSFPRFLDRYQLFQALMTLDLGALDWLNLSDEVIATSLHTKFELADWDTFIFADLCAGMRDNVSRIFAVPVNQLVGATYRLHKFKNCLWMHVGQELPSSFQDVRTRGLTYFSSTHPKYGTKERFGLSTKQIEMRLRLSGDLFRALKVPGRSFPDAIDKFTGYLMFLWDLSTQYRDDGLEDQIAFIRLLDDRTSNFNRIADTLSNGQCDYEQTVIAYRTCWLNYDRISVEGINNIFEDFEGFRIMDKEPNFIRQAYLPFGDMAVNIAAMLWTRYSMYLDNECVHCDEPFEQVRLEMIVDMFRNYNWFNPNDPLGTGRTIEASVESKDCSTEGH